ncbi:MAG: NADH-quinone oxidoreductase subunit NuoH [Anaerolineales bacterium]|nr:NADH-quinone oxidoreductase subunit NuoH [Anaerolineales bacterium]
MEWVRLIEWIIKAVISTAVLLAGFAYMTWAERKVAALLQQRIGPNRVGPFGLLQPVADGIKLIFKEELIPAQADKLIFLLAPVITVVPAFIILAVVPWGPPVKDFYGPGQDLPLGIANLNVGMMYILSVASIAVYGVTLGGWASNNKYATLGGLRSAAQMISYELGLGLSVVGPLMLAGSMSMLDITNAQAPVWFVFLQPLAALIFYIAALAEVNRAPFDMPEAEQELTAGYHTEYSGMKFALFFMAEYIKMIGVSAIFTTLFLGGWQGPFVYEFPWLGIVYFWGKIIASLVFMIWTRSTLPRLRYDRLMAFGWKVLLPAALVNVLVTAAALLGNQVILGAVLGALGVAVVIAIFFGLARRSRGGPAGRRARAAQSETVV